MVHKYMLSGSGVGQKTEDDSDYGKLDIEQCAEGNDRSNFMKLDVKETYVLYW